MPSSVENRQRCSGPWRRRARYPVAALAAVAVLAATAASPAANGGPVQSAEKPVAPKEPRSSTK